MAVRHIDSGIVHRGDKGEKTHCGFDTRDNRQEWVSTQANITCKKFGCRD